MYIVAQVEDASKLSLSRNSVLIVLHFWQVELCMTCCVCTRARVGVAGIGRDHQASARSL